MISRTELPLERPHPLWPFVGPCLVPPTEYGRNTTCQLATRRVVRVVSHPDKPSVAKAIDSHEATVGKSDLDVLRVPQIRNPAFHQHNAAVGEWQLE
jgi:hypothetical protein